MLRETRLMLQLLAVCPLFSFDGARCLAQEKPADIKTVMKERRDVLADAFEQMRRTYLANRPVSLQELTQAGRELLKADLDWLDKPEERIAAIEKNRKIAEEILKSAEASLAAGMSPGYTVAQARAYVLEVKLELLKEKQRQKARP